MKYLLLVAMMASTTPAFSQNKIPTLEFKVELQQDGEMKFIPKENTEKSLGSFPELNSECWSTGKNCAELVPWKVEGMNGGEAIISVPFGTQPSDWMSAIGTGKVELSGNYAATTAQQVSQSSKARRIMSDLMDAAAGEMCESKFAPKEIKVTVEAGFDIFVASKVIVEGTFVRDDICG